MPERSCRSRTSRRKQARQGASHGQSPCRPCGGMKRQGPSKDVFVSPRADNFDRGPCACACSIACRIGEADTFLRGGWIIGRIHIENVSWRNRPDTQPLVRGRSHSQISDIEKSTLPRPTAADARSALPFGDRSTLPR
jgi:hypothetical protein